MFTLRVSHHMNSTMKAFWFPAVCESNGTRSVLSCVSNRTRSVFSCVSNGTRSVFSCESNGTRSVFTCETNGTGSFFSYESNGTRSVFSCFEQCNGYYPRTDNFFFCPSIKDGYIINTPISVQLRNSSGRQLYSQTTMQVTGVMKTQY